MSPILVRPVREQLEHDRIIRLLQAKYKRRFEVGINPGHEQTAPAGTGTPPCYPDVVLHSTERTRKLQGVVEVETVESVNNLEAMSQWVAFGRLEVPFHLYVPVSMVDVARRLCSDLHVPVAEVWAYQAIGDQIRFTLVQRADPEVRKPARPAPAAAPAPAPAPTPARAAAARAPRAAAAPGRTRAARPAAGRTPARATATAARRPAAGKTPSSPASRRTTKTTKSSSAPAGAKTAKRR